MILAIQRQRFEIIHDYLKAQYEWVGGQGSLAPWPENKTTYITLTGALGGHSYTRQVSHLTFIEIVA